MPVVAGHQPNFFPWFGYFEKMLKCDVFVFSDDVRFPKQNYVNRVAIPIGPASGFLTLPVWHGHDDRIADKLYIRDGKALKRVVKTVSVNFGGLPHFADLVPVLAEFEAAYWRYEQLADLNIHMLLHLAGLFGIARRTVRGTALGLEAYRRNERLIRRCQLLESSVYLCGQGADDYQDEAMLNAAGIALRRIDYDLGWALFGEDLRYSVLYGIGKHGLAQVVAGVRRYQAAEAVS